MKRIVKWLFFVFVGITLLGVVLLIVFGSTRHSELKGTLPQKLSAFMDKKSVDEKFNGTVLVAKDGKILFQKGYGYSDSDMRTSNQIDTEFRIASLTKSFTALAILQLEDKGKLSTDDPISKYIPAFQEGDTVTIHTLLTHSSGVENHFKLTDTEVPITLPAFIKLMSERRLSFTPGTKYRYSNTGYMILAYIIEQVSGESYQEYFREHIFKMARMDHTYLSEVDARKLAVGYKNMSEDDMKEDESQLAGAGDIISTVGDLLKYDNAIHNHKLLPLTEEKKMETGYINSARWGVFRYGYGWNVASDFISFGKPMIEHNGNLPGFKSEIVDFINDRVTVIVLSNNNGSWNSGALAREMASICLNKRFWFFQQYF